MKTDYYINHRAQPLWKYLIEFMHQFRLWPSSGRALVGVSGGVDSMLLLSFFQKCRDLGLLKSLGCYHVNHHTREECQKEWDYLKRYCEAADIEWVGIDFKTDVKSNFEKHARDFRYKSVQKYLSAGDCCYLGHHIDDSFEWWLMQSFKSSRQDQLGIPVKNGVFRRPFMGLTKSQLVFVAEQIKLLSFHDQSNDCLSFERNYMRKSVIPQIKARYPQYLKHYVHRSNRLAAKLGVRADQMAQKPQISVDKATGGIVLFFHKSLRGHESEIEKSIIQLSHASRGKLHTQITKLVQACENCKKGPISFSGGVEAYLAIDAVLFIHKSSLKVFEKYDGQILQLLKKRTRLKKKTPRLFPFLAFSFEGQHKFEGQRSPHPLLPQSTRYAIEEGMAFRELGQLKRQGLGQMHFDYLC